MTYRLPASPYAPQSQPRARPSKNNASNEGAFTRPAVLAKLNVPLHDIQKIESILVRFANVELHAETWNRNVDVLLHEYSQPMVKQLVLSCPQLLSSCISDWLQFLVGYGFNTDSTYHILKACGPQWSDMSIYNAGRVLLFLQTIGLTPQEIRERVVMKYPLALTLPYDSLHALHALLTSMACSDAALKDAVCSNPRILATPLSSDLQPKLLQLKAAGCSQEDLCSIVPHCLLSLLTQPQSAVVSKLQYLHSCGFSPDLLPSLLVSAPAILTLAVSSIMDKWTFLNKVMGYGVRDVLLYPEFFEKDLMCCIRPRFLFVEQQGLHHKLRYSAPESAASFVASSAASSAPSSAASSAPSSAGSSTGSPTASSAPSSGHFLFHLLDPDDAAFQSALGVSSKQYIQFYNDLVVNQYYGVKSKVDVFDRPEPQRG